MQISCLALVERTKGKAQEYHPTKDEANKPKKFNPQDYTPEQLDIIEAALRLMLNPPKKEAEVIPPDQATE
jgi:hypothetical protein